MNVDELMAGARDAMTVKKVYGDPIEVPTPETAPKAPANPYGRSKLGAESALRAELEGSGTDFASLRFANVSGPRQDWRGEGGVVAVFAHALGTGVESVIYGDGTQTRDFVFVGDIVDAILAAAAFEGTLGVGGTGRCGLQRIDRC